MPAKQPRMLPLLTASQLTWRPPVREINPFGGLGVEPTRLFPIIVLSSLVTVEYGGWALLAGVLAQSGGFFVHLGLGQQGPAAVLDGDQGQQNDDREQAGGFHAHTSKTVDLTNGAECRPPRELTGGRQRGSASQCEQFARSPCGL